MNTRMTRVLVTGATGFVGGALLRILRARDDVEARGLGRRRVDDADVASVDLTQPVPELFGGWRPEVVVHAAARATQWGTPAQFRAQNVDATANLLDYARRAGVRRVVYVSSSSVFYRPADQFGISETTAIGPGFLNDYARTKHEGELLTARFDGEWVVARPRAVFGPGDTTLLPRIVEAAARGRLPFLGDRDDPAVGDLLYIDVLAEQLAAAALAPGLGGTSVNLASGEPVPLLPTIARILDGLGVPAPRRTLGRRGALALAAAAETTWRLGRLPGEPPLTRYAVWLLASSKTFDVARSRALFGAPSIGVEEGLERTIADARRRGLVDGLR
ncbi:NAD-dependent epimerase/dehydratase family protein [Agromyces sp. NPDC058136]|uniref:NAD-dependent epimerase/dehydratase family protein n=1 Tax=Agromyces sp. NPDC058136 TaxID=3346354 RepID=UPI0036D8D709